MVYRFASTKDLDLLVQLRLDFLEVDINYKDYDTIKNNCYSYFQDALSKALCDIILAEDDEIIVGTGIIFYYNSVPSTFNISGKNAYVTSIYVKEEFRRRGIATNMLSQLIEASKQKGYPIIMLNASDMGKALYNKFGFTEIQNGMILKTIL